MINQIDFSVATADAAKPVHLGTIRLFGVSAFATRPELAVQAIGGQRGPLLQHGGTCAAAQNETLVSQYVGGFPSRDMTGIADGGRRPSDGNL